MNTDSPEKSSSNYRTSPGGTRRLIMDTIRAGTSCRKRPLEDVDDEDTQSKKTCIIQAQNSQTTGQTELIETKSKVAEIISAEETDAVVTNAIELCDLPDAIVLNIFQNLTMNCLLHKIALVCKHWHTLSNDSQLWRRINLKGFKKVNDETLERLTSYSDNVYQVNLTDCVTLSDCALQKLLSRSPNLTSLTLIRCSQFGAQALEHIGLSCHKLTNLQLTMVPQLEDSSLTTISQGCKSLQRLLVNQCSRLSDKSITQVANNCPDLHTLCMDQCKKITDVSIEALVTGCPKMKILKLMQCNLSSKGLLLLAKFTHLEKLDISDNLEVSNKVAMEIVKHCKKLTNLNVSLCYSINDTTMEYIAKHAVNLETLFCISCSVSDKGLEYLGNHKKLKTLDIGWCRNITGVGARKIAESCTSLTYLGMVRCDKISIRNAEELVEDFPRVHFSSTWLDIKRLLKRAQDEPGVSGGENSGTNVDHILEDMKKVVEIP